MKNICVFCGSQSGRSSIYEQGADALGQALCAADVGLVYGGGATGLMGKIATTVLAHGGHVTGVIPEALKDRELAHDQLQKLEVVADMHERKAMMAKLSDAFIAMPGGFGTLEELFEAVTWNQLGFYRKPVGLLNVDGFYDRLVDFIRHQSSQGFVSDQDATRVVVESDSVKLIEQLI